MFFSDSGCLPFWTLRKYNLVANKALGQNFLVESDIATFIVDSANISKDTCVIEIGPGLGALTEIALEKAGLVMAFEIDANMVKILTETFKEKDNFILTNIDFLKVDIEKLIKEAEEADLLNDYGLYMNLADAIDSQGKKEVSNHVITETEWKRLTRRYCLWLS